MASDTGTPDVPRPDISLDQAAGIAEQLYGLTGEFKELGSQQDRNFRITGAEARYLLKIVNPAFSVDELLAQNIALNTLAAEGLAVPAPVKSLAGRELETTEGGLTVRLATFVEGIPLTDAGYLAAPVVAELGDLAARACLALANLAHPGLDRVLQWDLRRAHSVVHSLSGFIDDAADRELVLENTDAAWARISAIESDLRVAPIHGDLTDDNVVARRADDGRLQPFGIIDFGDLSSSWLVGEIAVTCSSVLHHNPDEPLSIMPAIEAFHSRIPLTDAEISALWPLIILRGAVLAASGSHQVSVDPGNEYAVNNLPHEWDVFRIASSVPAEVAEAAIRHALGLAPVQREPLAAEKLSRLIPDLDAAAIRIVDFSAASPDLDGGVWTLPSDETSLFAAVTEQGLIPLARYGEHRLTRAHLNSRTAPVNTSLHVEIGVPAGTPICAPAAGELAPAGPDNLKLRCGNFDLYLGGVELAHKVSAGSRVKTGQVFAQTSASRSALSVQVCLVPAITPPEFASASQAPAWLQLCPDPSPLLSLPGLDCAAPPLPDSEDLLARRKGAYAGVQKHYYETPPNIERGWRDHLVDTAGRSYLDMVNNVAGVGHGHPRIADAVARQLRTLNTNSRFHYGKVAEFSERLAALAPDGFDTVLLVNSGTEAVDLALRLAQAHTKRTTIISLDESYHGWSMGADGVSASTADNPSAIGTRPEWTRFLNAPNAYRGAHRGPDSAGGYIADAQQALADWTADGTEIAGFICEPIFGNGGGILLPDGYLAGMYDLVRAAGGVCIADEVQVGYGRLGHTFWGFDQQGAVPDIITVAKAMGNGHPLGAVITRREIAESLSAQGAFFASAGGSPVSCVTGLTVLDIMEDERLQDNARDTGDYLRRKLLELAGSQPMIGAVHGQGLYLGVELIRDRESLEPASAETSAICDRLLQLGVIVQPTGDRGNVLKVKPPLCITVADADFFVARLEEALTDGW